MIEFITAATRNKHRKSALFSYFSILLILLSLISGCESQKVPPITIGILLFGDSRQPQVDGFMDEMNKTGFKEKHSIRYVIRNAKNNRKILKNLLNELSNEKPDLLIAAGGLEADTMKRNLSENDVPVVVLYVNAIVERGLVNNRHHSGWNVTGVDNLNAELSGKRVEFLHNMLPNAKKILILYYERIAPSKIGVKEARIVAKKIGIEVDARAVSSRDEISIVMKSIKAGEIDAMLTVPTAPIDNALKDIILPEIARLRIPLFTHSRPLAELGAFASYGAGFYELGQQSARLAKKILNGVPASKTPFETPKKFIYTVNKDTQNYLNIKLPVLMEHQVNEFTRTRQ